MKKRATDDQERRQAQKCARPNPPTIHRVSSLSSSSSASSSADVPSSKRRPLFRTVRSIGVGVAVGGGPATASASDEASCSKRNPREDECGRRLTRLVNGRILQEDGSLLRGAVIVDPGTGLIVDVEYGSPSNEDEQDVIDCDGHILSPGFIDIQINGGFGVDFSSDGLTIEDISYFSERLVETGVTSFCPTMVSSSSETYRHVLALMRRARQNQASGRGNFGAYVLGMHLEGPFFAESKRGAHDAQHVISPLDGMGSVAKVYGVKDNCDESLGGIDIITLAPELEGAHEAIAELTRSNRGRALTEGEHSVVVSCGHTEATYSDGIEALRQGATLLTHLYNAMNPFHHRHPGLVGLLSSEAKLASMSLKRPHYSMIVDGIHVHESAVAMAYKSHPDGCVLVTDAMAALGLDDGEHTLGNMKVNIRGDRATLPGTETLAGAVVGLDECVRRFQRFTCCSAGQALQCATVHPSIVLKRDTAASKQRQTGRGLVDAPIGTIKAGSRADIIILDDALTVLETWLAGKCAYQRNLKQN